MKSRTLSPSMLRIILSIALVLFFFLGIVIFILGYKRLGVVNADAQTIATKAQESQSSLNRLMATKTLLENNASTVERANQLVAQSRSYVYQDQIISDINKYATEAGLSITDITFTDSKTTATGSGASSTSSTGAASASSGTTGTSTGTASVGGTTPAGIKSVTAQVTTANPVSYIAMLTFIHLVEQSLFRMQISQINLSRSDAAGSNQISSNALTIEVFIR